MYRTNSSPHSNVMLIRPGCASAPRETWRVRDAFAQRGRAYGCTLLELPLENSNSTVLQRFTLGVTV